MDTHFNGYTKHSSVFLHYQQSSFSRAQNQQFRINKYKDIVELYSTSKSDNLSAPRISENAVKSNLEFYCGKFRKSAVKTCTTVLGPVNLDLKDDNCGGKSKKMVLPNEHGFEMDKSFVGSESENYHVRKVFDERSEREKSRKKCVMFDKFSKVKMVVMNSNKVDSKLETGFDNFVIDVVDQRKNMLSFFREVYDSFKEQGGKPSARIDLKAWDVVNESGLLIMSEKTIGPVPGVEVDDSFDFRVELMIMGIHSVVFRGIDYKEMQDSQVLATSIVATEEYDESTMNPNELIYIGEGGGTFESNGKEGEDLELKLGNLSLKNSMKARNYVRVVRGIKSNVRVTTTFVYDGLYKVVGFDEKMGSNGKVQFKFKLERCSGQKSITWVKYK